MDFFVIADELCTAADGTGISNRVPTCGFGNWENGTGLFALGASIQSNKIQRTAAGAGTQVQHNMLNASGFPTDLLSFCCDIGRPADASNTQRGFFFRGNAEQFNGASNDGIYVYWDRVSSTLVDIKVLVQSDGANGQQSTRATNVSWAENTELCLGITVSGASLQVWTAPALAARTGPIPTTSERTNRGAALTLTPEVFNDDDHRYYGAWGRTGTNGGTWDNFYVWVDAPTPVSRILVTNTNQTTRTLSIGAKTGLGTVTYDWAYSLDGKTWTTLATDDADGTVAWNTTGLGARWARARVRYGNACNNGPWRVSAPFQINVAAS